MGGIPLSRMINGRQCTLGLLRMGAARQRSKLMSNRQPREGTDAPTGTSTREYPHTSGDRNTKSPLRPEKDEVFDGGTQRDAPPDGERVPDKE